MSLNLSDPCRQYSAGINYPWENFAADFGDPNRLVNDQARQQRFRDAFTSLKNQCYDHARIWLFPELWTSSYAYDASGCIIAHNDGPERDVVRLLEIAKECDFGLQLCFFSFDNFKRRNDSDNCSNPDVTSAVPASYGNLQRMYLNGCIQGLCDHIIAPIVTAAESSGCRQNIHSWDVMNEPTQVTNGNVSIAQLAQQFAGNVGVFQTQEYQPNRGEQDPDCFYHLNITQMRDMVGQFIACVKQNGTCPVTVGVDAKWAFSYAGLGQDFHSIHTYFWGEPFFPTRDQPVSWFINDGLPGEIGEHPTPCSSSLPRLDQNIPNRNQTIAQDNSNWCDQGWMGAKSWSLKIDNGGGSCISELGQWMAQTIKRADRLVLGGGPINCNGGPVVITAQVQNGKGQRIRALNDNVQPTLPNSNGWTWDITNCWYRTTVQPDASCAGQTPTVTAGAGGGNVSSTISYFDGAVPDPDPPNPGQTLVIDQCSGGQLELEVNTPRTLTASGCPNPASIVWSSTSSAVSFNPPTGSATTQVTANLTGSFPITVTCT
jgi:hypothetical protein